jgi:DNA-directed RNA polymerase subunit RPC12/RpoP
MPKPATVLQCPRCGSRTLKIELIGSMLKNGKVTGGTKEYVCSPCDRKGQRVVVA